MRRSCGEEHIGFMKKNAAPSIGLRKIKLNFVLQHHLASLNEQLDWTNLYWENSGFTSLSPFTEMRI